MSHHVNSRIENDLLRFAVDITNEAKLERKQFGRMKGSRNVVTINGQSHLYNPNKLSKVLLNKLDKLSKANKYKEVQELKKSLFKTSQKQGIENLCDQIQGKY